MTSASRCVCKRDTHCNLSTCISKCDSDPSCVSFEFKERNLNDGTCQLSTSCIYGESHPYTYANSFTKKVSGLYIKKATKVVVSPPGGVCWGLAAEDGVLCASSIRLLKDMPNHGGSSSQRQAMQELACNYPVEACETYKGLRARAFGEPDEKKWYGNCKREAEKYSKAGTSKYGRWIPRCKYGRGGAVTTALSQAQCEKEGRYNGVSSSPSSPKGGSTSRRRLDC